VCLVDTHAHLNHPDFSADLPQVLQRARQAGVAAVVVVGYDEPSSARAVQQAEEHPQLWAAVGVHPHDAGTLTPALLSRLRAWAAHPKVVAIGEIGLDFYRDLSPRDAQRQALRDQIRLARDCGLPVIIHDREAHEELFGILRDEDVAAVGGVMHCFCGDWPFARRCVEELGLHVGIAGPVTFGKHNPAGAPGSLGEVARLVPLERLLLETDCPYLAPQPYRGKRNEPGYVTYVADQVATLRGMANALALFRLPT
jgi:TatD DNase family protein